MPMNEGYAVLASAKKKVIKKRPEDMGRSKKVAVAKKTAPAKMTPKTGGRAKESMPGVRGTGTGTGTGYKPNSAAGRGKGGEAMGRNNSSSAQAGKFAPKKKAPVKGSKY